MDTYTPKALSTEIAEEEVKKWLEYKRISFNREDEEDMAKFKNLVKGFMIGNLILQDDFKITQKLKWPLQDESGNDAVSELVYKPRLNVKQINAKMKGVKATDADGRIVGYVAALTDQNTGIIEKLDTADNSVAQSIVMYFL